VRDNATAILGPSSEPQPDAALIIDPASGGQTEIAVDGYASGPPELLVEVASSSASIDLHSKRDDYEHAGVLEYIVVVVRQGVMRWFVLNAEGRYCEATAPAGGMFTSTVFPGLWLDPAALLQLDGQRLMATLRQGLATPEHAAFVQRLQAQRRV
jgi:Uma2 family endonuclease